MVAKTYVRKVMAEIALSTLFEANVVECFMKDWLICGPSSVFNLGETTHTYTTRMLDLYGRILY